MNPLDAPPEFLDVPPEEQDDFYSDDDLFKIQSWGADLSFRELISRYDEDELVKPELQRYYVWDKSEASRFIDSILLGLPVPSIFLAKTKNEKLLIIDGYQRLMTVRDYVKGIFSKDGRVFKLSRTEKVHSRWRGKAFAELEEEEQRRIRNTTIHAIIFMQRSPSVGDTSLFQVFERINSSGRTLLPQEIRNCVYQGPFNSLLLKLNENESWRRLFGKELIDDRMRDVEYILRFFALSSDQILFDDDPPSRISLKKYLNQFMDLFNDQEYMASFESKFTNAISKAEEAFGESAFHNISQTDPNHLVERFSPTLFDSVLVAFYLAERDGKPGIGADSAKSRKQEILRGEEFQRLLSQETMRVPNIRDRIFRMYNALFSE
ncbi:DUF262 domain-containing protein [Pseudomaricurvus sp. HS19]|uniref:DUF262 domain-containing protein n=1 Tax=Pseudomaricurvus sp. HS19 TaxID=2692626 RepID=UPI00136F6CED|nr:DUF262 domain-containing protein [Pseudomaricurvus sp. HS19]MYM64196.1 DUF262 domain-containing protein [Pseudomaricurvus sp. HS19]